jgi:hypothetical protein
LENDEDESISMMQKVGISILILEYYHEVYDELLEKLTHSQDLTMLMNLQNIYQNVGKITIK